DFKQVVLSLQIVQGRCLCPTQLFGNSETIFTRRRLESKWSQSNSEHRLADVALLVRRRASTALPRSNDARGVFHFDTVESTQLSQHQRVARTDVFPLEFAQICVAGYPRFPFHSAYLF